MEIICREIPGKPEVKIRLLDVNRLQYRRPTWSQYRDVMTRALERSKEEDFSANDIIDALEKTLKDRKAIPDQGEVFRIVNGFRNVLEEKEPRGTPFSVIMHTEAVLCSLGEFYHRTKGEPSEIILKHDAEMRKACQVRVLCIIQKAPG